MALRGKDHDRPFRRRAALIIELHPYETPEIIATPVVAASDAYSNWLQDALR